MPDQTVEVTFSPPDSFTFTPECVSMTAAGKIVLHRSPGDAAWTFVSVDDLPSPEYTWSLKGSGHSAEVDDGHTANGECHYGITVQDGGSTYSSDENPKQTAPPMIVNQ